jgi:hypothetical protein
MIDPSIWEDLTIGQLSRDARLCFIGMLSYADDEGRVQVDPRYIKRAVFGFDDDLNAADVGRILDELRQSVSNIVFYEVDGKKIAAFQNWRRYQYIQKPQPSTLPAPPREQHAENGIVPVSYQSGNGSEPVALNRIEVNRKEVNGTEPNARARAEAATDTNGNGTHDDHEETIEEARARVFVEYGLDRLKKK